MDGREPRRLVLPSPDPWPKSPWMGRNMGSRDREASPSTRDGTSVVIPRVDLVKTVPFVFFPLLSHYYLLGLSF